MNKCYCCGSTHFKDFFINNSALHIRTSEDFFYGGHAYIKHAFQCARCGFIQQDPDLSDRTINDLYASADTEYYLMTRRQRRVYFKAVYKQLLMTGLLQKTDADRSSIIDIGAGSGEWLHLWNSEKYASEANESLINILKSDGINVIPGEVNQLKNQSFSVLSMFDFLEHVVNPEDCLNIACSKITPGGTLIIGVPDFGSWISKLLRHKYYLFTPMHLGYHNRESLTYLLDKNELINSFEIMKSPPFPVTLKSILKWIRFLRIPLPKRLEEMVLPFGYSASLIAIATIKR